MNMNLALWIAQGLLAFAFLYSGGSKLRPYDKYAASITGMGTTAAPRNLTPFIGIMEVVGAFGVVLPLALNVAPFLSALAAFGFATVMLLAIGYHLRANEPLFAQVGLFLLAAFVAFGRLLGTH